MKNYTIAVAGTGYVGLSIATLLSQHHKVYAVDIIPEKVEMINDRKSPIQDEYIEKYLAEKELDLTATLDAKLMMSKKKYTQGTCSAGTKEKEKSYERYYFGRRLRHSSVSINESNLKAAPAHL